jgi:type IV pilus assembly protein PilQ
MNLWSTHHPIRLITILLVSMLMLSSIGFSQTSGDKISIKVKEVKLENVLRILSDKSGMIFISDPDIRTNKITLDLTDIAPLEALSIMTELYDLGFQQLGSSGKYLVTDKDNIAIPTRTASYSCQFSEATDLARTVAAFVSPDIGKIYGDERTNIVIIQDTPGQVAELTKLMEKLDTHTQQVHIKSAIVEVSVSNDQTRGVQWFTSQDGKNGEQSVFGTEFGLRGNNGMDPLITPVLPDIAGGFGIGLIAADIDVVLGFLAATNDLNLLSTPHLMTLDNKQAEIEVGDQIPYPKLNEFGMVSYEFKNATVKLTLRVHVNNDSTVTIKLEPQANFQQGLTPDNIPIISTRRAQTEVIVKNGQTVILGGLMQESDVVTVQKVPILGSLPLLGEFFRYTQTNKRKTELMVMLTPTIVDVYNNSVQRKDLEKVPKEFLKSLK